MQTLETETHAMLERQIDESRLAWQRSSFRSPADYTYRLGAATLRDLAEERDDSDDLSADIQAFRSQFLTTGCGLGVIDGLSPERFSPTRQRAIHWRIARLLGTPIPQNIQGDTLVEVCDRGKTMEQGGRYHQTRQGGSLHTDSPQWRAAPDYLGLLCLNQARRGGESKLVSAYSIHNRLRQHDPELLEVLYQPFHFDKRGEFGAAESPTTLVPIFTFDGRQLRFRYLRNYIDAAYQRLGLTLSRPQQQALTALDEMLEDETLTLTMDLKPGQIQYLDNHRVVHGRNAFQNYPEPAKKRLMVRVWISAHA